MMVYRNILNCIYFLFIFLVLVNIMSFEKINLNNNKFVERLLNNRMDENSDESDYLSIENYSEPDELGKINKKILIFNF